jgi:MoaA/NifB/PqqE/SkfB family radical SAM enzyme
MYNLNDYLRSGFTYVNNSIRPGHKRLDTLMIYATTRCQSACKHCNIWKKPQEHLTLADIKRLMTAKCVTKNTNIGLEGGEFVLHPQADEIMEWFMEHHPKYTLLSNCLATRKTIESVPHDCMFHSTETGRHING